MGSQQRGWGIKDRYMEVHLREEATAMAGLSEMTPPRAHGVPA
jgi:hypothetical protein